MDLFKILEKKKVDFVDVLYSCVFNLIICILFDLYFNVFIFAKNVHH